MRPFRRLEAIAAPVPIMNVDTDKILAGRFLKTISREGLGDKLFWAMRQERQFVLDQVPWTRAGILITLDNFGCGSSREHAPWALLDLGIRCIISPSIADIFYNNCFKNGILPVILPTPEIDRLLTLASDPASALMIVDLETQTVASADGRTVPFAVDPGRRADLLDGVDEIDRSLRYDGLIATFEARHRSRQPWIVPISPSAVGDDGPRSKGLENLRQPVS